MRSSAASRILLFTVGGGLFLLLATANGAGYRYGASDQAFYIPAIARVLDPSLFPRDGALIDAEGRLMLADEMLAAVVRATGLSLEAIFLAGYLIGLLLIWTAAVLIGSRVYTSRWAIVALGAGLTLRHRIPRTSANSFEPYFHPRVIAFGLGAIAVAAVLRRRDVLAAMLVAVAASIHITTALWFAVLLGVALAVVDRRWRPIVAAGAVGAAIVLAISVTWGPLHGALRTMDATWLQAVASKDSLFATDWPAWAWAANGGLIICLWAVHWIRSVRGAATERDTALVWGATALVVLFIATLPLVAGGLSLAVQFQIQRVFWVVEFIVLIYTIAVVAERRTHVGPGSRTDAGPAVAGSDVRVRSVALVLLIVSIGRGTYVMQIEHPERGLFELQLRDSAWKDAMQWIAVRPEQAHVLADPGHAWKYGVSVRVLAERDVLLEEVKDSALAIYSRDVAARVVERTSAVGDFASLTADRARDLARRYAIDYLVTEADLPLPAAYRNHRFRIYDLRQ